MAAKQATVIYRTAHRDRPMTAETMKVARSTPISDPLAAA
jgi:hypothetical protein